MRARSRVDALFHGTAARQLHLPRHRQGERERERDGQSARAGACGKLVRCIMYLSLYLVGNYFAIVMTFRYSVRYLRNAISLIYHPDLVFLAGHFVANADTCPASASVIDNRSPTSPSPLTFLGTTVPNCSHRITQVERTVADLINRLNSSKFVPPLNAFFLPTKCNQCRLKLENEISQQNHYLRNIDVDH